MRQHFDPLPELSDCLAVTRHFNMHSPHQPLGELEQKSGRQLDLRQLKVIGAPRAIAATRPDQGTQTLARPTPAPLTPAALPRLHYAAVWP